MPVTMGMGQGQSKELESRASPPCGWQRHGHMNHHHGFPGHAPGGKNRDRTHLGPKYLNWCLLGLNVTPVYVLKSFITDLPQKATSSLIPILLTLLKLTSQGFSLSVGDLFCSPWLWVGLWRTVVNQVQWDWWCALSSSSLCVFSRKHVTTMKTTWLWLLED